MTHHDKFENFRNKFDRSLARKNELEAQLQREIERLRRVDELLALFDDDAADEPSADDDPTVADEPEIISEPLKDEPVIVGEPDLDDMEENDFALFYALHKASRDTPGEWLTDCQLFKLAQPHGFTLKRPSVSNRMTHSPKALMKRYPHVIKEQAKPLAWRMVVADNTDDESHVSVPRNFSDVMLDEGAPLPFYDEAKHDGEFAAFEDSGHGKKMAGRTRWALVDDQKTFTIRKSSGKTWLPSHDIDRADVPLAIRLSIENGFTWTCNPTDASLAAALTDKWQNATEICERAKKFNYRLKEASVRRWLNGAIRGYASTIEMFAARGVVIEFKEMDNRRHVWRVKAA